MSGDERKPLGFWSWVSAALAVGVVIAGQSCWVTGERTLGGGLVAVGGVALAAVILRAALAGLPRKRKR
jgi:hypothetical protein